MRMTVSARTYLLPAVALVFAALFYLFGRGALTPGEYRDYKSGEVITVSEGMTVTVPLGYDALWHRDGDPRHEGPGVSMTAAGREVTESPPPDLISVDEISAEQLTWWDKTDAHYRSIESTGVYEPGFEEFDLDRGWSAAVTTRYEERPSAAPVCIVIANLSRGGQPPVRVTAFYHQRPPDRSVPPDPRTMFARVQQHIALVLP